MGVPINNVPRRVVYVASGTGPYAFTFEILAAGDIAVYRDDTLLTITTDYTVAISPDGTGSVTLTANPTGATQIAIVGNRTIQRTTDFVTGGDFFANTLNDELDQQTIFAQQNAEGLGRSLQAPQTDPTTINMTLPRAADRANKYLAFDANGNPQPGDTAIEVAAVAAITDEIVVVADNVAVITAVADNIAAVLDASTQAAAAAAAASDASDSADAAAVSASAVAATYDEFDDRYLGSKASDPTLDNDGNALLTGALYFNTGTSRLRVYGGSAWADAGTAIPLTITTQEFSGNGSTVAFTLSQAPAFEAAADVYISGVAQKVDVDYNIAGTTLTFTTAPPSGTDNIYVKILSAYSGGVPNNGSVTTAKLVDGAVTTAKLASTLDYGSIV
jgi:hypothetical protein